MKLKVKWLENKIYKEENEGKNDVDEYKLEKWIK
jgi:hypothetical protein